MTERSRSSTRRGAAPKPPRLPDQVPHELKVERVQRLVEVVQRRAHERAQRFVGRTLDVLVEGPSRTDPSRLRGRSRHNKVVNFTGLGAPGELVDVEILDATSQTLSGQESILSRAAADIRPLSPFSGQVDIRPEADTAAAAGSGAPKR